MKKYLLAVLAFASAMAFTSVANAESFADKLNFTPKVGYQFEVSDTKNKQIDSIGTYQKNQATYGVEVAYDLDQATKLGIEYLRTDSNIDSYQVGVIGTRTITGPFYATGGLGYYNLDGTKQTVHGGVVNGNPVITGVEVTGGKIEGAYLNFGVGAKKQLTDAVALKAEVRGQYLMNHDQWTPVALIGLELRTNK